MNRIKTLLALTLVALLGSGCAFSVDRIDLGYIPQAGVEQVPGAQDITVDVAVRDVRPQTDRVGYKQNGYGVETAAIVANQDVTTFFEQMLEAELQARGYRIGEGKPAISCEVDSFQNKWQVGMWSGSAIANARMLVKIKDADQNYIYSETITGEGIHKGV